MAVTIDSTLSKLFLVYYCNQSLKKSVQLSKSINFAMNSFKIGEGYIGKMREFKFYKAALGA